MSILDLFLSGWPVFILVALIITDYRLAYRHTLVSVAALYFIGCGVWAASFPWTPDHDPRIAVALKYAASLTTLATISLVALQVSLKKARLLTVFQGLACILALLTFLSPAPTLAVWPGQNPSMTASFIAVLLPTLAWWTWPFLIVAVLATGATTPMVAVVAAGVTWGVARMLHSKRDWSPGLGLIIGLVILGGLACFRHPEGLDSNGRLAVWRLGWHGFLAHPWFGNGAGSAQILIPLAQAKLSGTGGAGFFMFLHNDWLQLAFEYGVVGFGLVLSLYGLLLRSSSSYMLPSLVAYGVVMFTNFPLHSPLHAALGLALYTSARYIKP